MLSMCLLYTSVYAQQVTNQMQFSSGINKGGGGWALRQILGFLKKFIETVHFTQVWQKV